MHLKTLTLRGFKSFASSTTLRFEPGITCVVGPNGSGKSNVVDAIAWVLGEQGAKSLRGGKMEDVIFAGTAGRPPLGRAEVVLTIDNTDGALPIDYTEVTISRLMYRSGLSEYAINGQSCRLLDIQELLSDSGIGREMHVVVGQGQLDAVLTSRPEDRRAFIEEAAGVLKHRKRKEKALRKLEAMAANLTRLTDLTAELRRQLGPLGRQAEVARRAAAVQAQLRDARLRLLADDHSRLTTTLTAEVADETAARQRRAALEQALAEARSREAALRSSGEDLAPRVRRASENYHRLAALRERLRGMRALAQERRRLLSAEPERAAAGPDPAELDRQAATARSNEAELAALLAHDRKHLAGRVAWREGLERDQHAAEGAVLAAVRAVADRREGLARLTGQVGALRSRVTTAAEEIARLSAAEDAARSRATAAQAAFAELETTVAGLDAGEVDLDSAYEQAVGELDAADGRVRELEALDRDLDRRRSALGARCEALELALTPTDAVAAWLETGDRPGFLGELASLLTVEPGAEAAVAAALGSAADAVAVESLADACTLLADLRAGGIGRVGVLVGEPEAAVTGPARTAPPAAALARERPGTAAASSARPVLELVDAPARLRPALERLLADAVVVADLAAAGAVVESRPVLRAVTHDGDLVGAGWAEGGARAAASRLEVQAAADRARQDLAEASAERDRVRFAMAAAAAVRTEALERVEEALEALHSSDARLAAVAERLGELGAAARAAAGESERLGQARIRALEGHRKDVSALEALEARLTAAQSSPPGEPDTGRRDELLLAVAEARRQEVDARLAVRTAEERVRALAGQADALLAAAARERAARASAAAARERRVSDAAVAGAVMAAAVILLDRLETSLAAAAAQREAVEAGRAALETDLEQSRARLAELGVELATLTDEVHRDEVARAEQRLRVEALEQRALADYGIGAGDLVEEYGPSVPVPSTIGAGASDQDQVTQGGGMPYERDEQERRARAAERALSRLGRVNPLALEEYAALEERHGFLAAQLDDLTATRRHLLTVVAEVDERVKEVFAAAFADTAREFEGVFTTLFPGGTGRLVLTDPDDLLATGIEVEARPAGKKVQRLSLLSGGERSLTAIALLVAIFRARPSPFYVLDEVEAALDDRNLDRLVTLLGGLRATSQLIVITHQKRTMEAADALYGVSMRGDGITTVISQRLSDRVGSPDRDPAGPAADRSTEGPGAQLSEAEQPRTPVAAAV